MINKHDLALSRQGHVHSGGRRLYFAYGSNMDSAQMGLRCAEAFVVGLACLHDFRFITNQGGVATLIPWQKSMVYGVVWSLSGKNEEALDRYEGVEGGLYAKIEIAVMGANDTPLQVMLYLASDTKPGCAIRKYMLRIITAATALRFPLDYQLELVGWLRKDAASMSWLK